MTNIMLDEPRHVRTNIVDLLFSELHHDPSIVVICRYIHNK
jgi:hypothetical protein